MWFGDLVTMRWWDDLWLNESFAEYMAHRTCVAATEFTEGWVDSTVARKMWGYAAERTPSTHPVAGAAALDTQAALQDFDGISYAKGAAALRQLIAHIGDDAFIDGVSAYLREHAFGNGTLADFLRLHGARVRPGPRWVEPRLAADRRSSTSSPPTRTAVSSPVEPRQPTRPTGRTPSMSPGSLAGNEVFRVPVTALGDTTDCRGAAGHADRRHRGAQRLAT